MPLADTIDHQEICDGCEAPLSLHELADQDMIEVNGLSFCDGCWGIWKAEMKACTHVFDGGTCQKCGFVPDVNA